MSQRDDQNSTGPHQVPDGQYISDQPADSPANSSAQGASPGLGGPMQTAMQQFGEQFAAGIKPLLEPMSQTAKVLSQASETCKPRGILPDLRELRHHLASLIDKVADQQAYVLIFGPLKSGKSTFMNALCGSYVSEVTALPAYPCLVHVAGGEDERFSLTRYDGSSETIADRDRLEDQIETAHRSLTQRVRQVEADGGSFDPPEHMPSAIRRIDVRLPLDELLQSGAVLVDTPGLYTRMKFGYDRMTREFRNSAACAIFTVKTDTLFLEQVFDEFGQLLELFSRVFLVVNLDSNKKDLRPDGTLEPSLESRQPAQILEAFRDLTMSGPLRQAADDGRLRIYGVDLLSAASERLSGDKGDGQSTEQFGQLVGDLTEYLNSSEYLQEFLCDSLRRTRTLLGELGQLLDSDAVGDLYEQRRMLREERCRIRKQIQAMHRLDKFAWPRQKNTLQDRLADGLIAQAGRVQQQTDQALEQAIDHWFDSEQSLADLNEQAIRPLLTSARARMVEQAGQQLARQLRQQHAGLDITDDVADDLKAGQIDLGQMVDQALEATDPDTALAANGFGLVSKNIPVKRRLRDWMLIRSRKKVRRILLGGDDAPQTPISPTVKSKQIGQPGRDAMVEIVRNQLTELIDEVRQALSGRLAERATRHLQQQFEADLARSGAEANEQLHQAESLLTEAETIARHTDALRQAVNQASLAAENMDETFVESAMDQTANRLEIEN